MNQSIKKKILVIGHARHGKDSVAQHLAQKYNLSYRGSSEVCADWIFEILKDEHGYKTSHECFEDRVNHRALWHKLIKAYNMDDLGRLGRLILMDNDIYCGIRNPKELEAIIEEWDPIVLWVDASKRCPLEPADSMGIKFDPERFEYLDNNGTWEELLEQL